jgi:hypothetical protein
MLFHTDDFSCGLVFGGAAIKLKIPAGGMIARWIAVAGLNIMTGCARSRPAPRYDANDIRAFHRLQITRDELKSLRRVIKPAFINMALIIRILPFDGRRPLFYHGLRHSDLRFLRPRPAA